MIVIFLNTLYSICNFIYPSYAVLSYFAVTKVLKLKPWWLTKRIYCKKTKLWKREIVHTLKCHLNTFSCTDWQYGWWLVGYTVLWRCLFMLCYIWNPVQWIVLLYLIIDTYGTNSVWVSAVLKPVDYYPTFL